MIKKLLIALGVVTALGMVLTVVAGSVPLLRSGMAVAQEVDSEDSLESVVVAPD